MNIDPAVNDQERGGCEEGGGEEGRPRTDVAKPEQWSEHDECAGECSACPQSLNIERLPISITPQRSEGVGYLREGRPVKVPRIVSVAAALESLGQDSGAGGFVGMNRPRAQTFEAQEGGDGENGQPGSSAEDLGRHIHLGRSARCSGEAQGAGCFDVDSGITGSSFVRSVMSSTQTIVLATPVWNDSARLAQFGGGLARALATADLRVRWVIADDGSAAAERSRYLELCEQFTRIYPAIECYHAERRCRKGGAIYDAWMRYPEANWYAFVDADGAVSPETLLALVQRAMQVQSSGAVIGIRALEGEMAVRRTGRRLLGFRVFRALVRWIAGVRIADTQCGIKVVPGEAFRAVLPKLSERGFVFDVELLVALQGVGCAIDEVPIEWAEIPGSRVTLSRDGFQMLLDLIRIGRKRRAGWYEG